MKPNGSPFADIVREVSAERDGWTQNTWQQNNLRKKGLNATVHEPRILEAAAHQVGHAAWEYGSRGKATPRNSAWKQNLTELASLRWPTHKARTHGWGDEAATRVE